MVNVGMVGRELDSTMRCVDVQYIRGVTGGRSESLSPEMSILCMECGVSFVDICQGIHIATCTSFVSSTVLCCEWRTGRQHSDHHNISTTDTANGSSKQICASPVLPCAPLHSSNSFTIDSAKNPLPLARTVTWIGFGLCTNISRSL